MENLHGKRGNPQTDEEGFVIKLCHSTATQEVESPNCSSIQETEKVGGSDMLAEPTPSVGTECVVFSPPLSPDLTPVVSTAIVMVSPPLMHDPMPITMVSSCETEYHTSPLHPTQSHHTSSVEKVTNSKRIPEIEDFRYTGNVSKAIGDSKSKRKLAESVGGKEKAIGDSSIKHQLRESAGGKEKGGETLMDYMDFLRAVFGKRDGRNEDVD